MLIVRIEKKKKFYMYSIKEINKTLYIHTYNIAVNIIMNNIAV